ncbi:MAG: RNA polymerase sigma factor [Ruminococcus sp.]|nr:RNA polymerase sigma factor [Ruminococcus sp.]
MTYEQVIDAYKQTVAGVCLMRLKNYADVEDCFQNTFFKLYQSCKQFESQEHLKAWLIRVAINECNKLLRNSKRLLPLTFSSKDTVSFPYDKCDISWALIKLDVKYRQVLYLHYVEDYQVSQIAQILDKNENTVKSLLRRGREKLKIIYTGESYE